jgi:hypothetical protein
MRRLLTGILTTTLLLLNTLVLIGPLLVFALLKLVLPGRGRDYASWAVMWMAETWSEIDKPSSPCASPPNGTSAASRTCARTPRTWRQQPPDLGRHPGADRKPQPPHAVLQVLPEKELIWVPLLGLAWWGLDYPFMKRYSKAFLDKHPELKGKDLEITKAACELFKRQPVTVVNYLEGTRFTEPSARSSSRRIATCSSPRPAAWRLCWRRWASSWMRCWT